MSKYLFLIPGAGVALIFFGPYQYIASPVPPTVAEAPMTQTQIAEKSLADEKRKAAICQIDPECKAHAALKACLANYDRQVIENNEIRRYNFISGSKRPYVKEDKCEGVS